jgi:hypothetical protein
MGTLLAIILILTAAVIYLLFNDQHRHTEKEVILHQFNKADVARLNEMVARHQEGKGDFLLLVTQTGEGGHIIHDVHSDGKTLTWTIDNTRDAFAGPEDRKKHVYMCKNIQVRQNSERYVYTVDQCEGHGDTFLPIFRLRKDSIEG